MSSENEKKMVGPKFITAELVSQVVDLVLNAIMFGDSPLCKLLKRQACHIVVLVPSMEDDRATDYAKWPVYPIEPLAIYDRSFGDKEIWSAPYDDIARCKALQLWGDRNDDRTDIMPHLLFSGDTPCWGGVKRHGIVVACSGVQSFFDKMISGMIADAIAGFGYNAYEISQDNKDNVNFLT